MGLLDVFSKKEKKSPDLELPPPPPLEEQELPPLPEEMAVEEPPEPFEAEEPDDSAELEVYEPEEVHEPEAKKILPEREGPLFVSVQDYQAILDSLESVKAKLGETETSFEQLSQIKVQQQQKIEQWRKTLEDVQKKLTYVDEVIFGKR